MPPGLFLMQWSSGLLTANVVSAYPIIGILQVFLFSHPPDLLEVEVYFRVVIAVRFYHKSNERVL